ncbi:MAG: M1 family metallopeptidase [candidate division KSB1 bacterium]|nr:M1 family metallopeptidase [candidate division KSB1 bacterium]
MRLTLTYPLLLSFISLLLPNISSEQIIFPRPLSPRIANYTISATLDSNQKAITGHELLTWHNTSDYIVTELQFHLYMNAFKNSETTFYEELGHGRGRFREEKNQWGYIRVDSMRIVGGSDVTHLMEFIQPDDANPNDQTVMKVKLPRPLKPHESIQLRINFYTKLPRIVARTGYQDDFFLVAQWFPKIGVYQKGAWNCHQFHANSEFFSDFGVYEVDITLPKKFKVGATGVLLREKENEDGIKTWHFRAEDVHDFVWTASPNFLIAEDHWEHVKILFYHQPAHRHQVNRHLNAARSVLKYCKEWYGDYPYPTLTIVDPPAAAHRAGGMEYPTFITGFTYALMPKGLRLPEMVVIHEFIHNYWYGMVASNEFEEPWLDEGFTTYTELKMFETLYGTKGNLLNLWGIRLSNFESLKARYLAGPDLDIICRKAWEFYPGSYSINAYAKPALMLITLENYLGPEVMEKIMRTYFQRWRFKHPTTLDFMAVVNEVSGQDLSWFFDQVLFGSDILDYEVSHVSSRKIPKPTEPGIETEEKPGEQEATGKADTLRESEESPKKREQEMYLSEVRIRRLGGVIFPLEVLIKFENGEEIRESWDGQSRWVRFKYQKPARLVSAQVDPENKLALDINLTNNSRTLKSQSKGVYRLTFKWLFWMQNILQLFSFLS